MSEHNNNTTSHLREVILIYGIVFGVSGLLIWLTKGKLKDYTYLVIGALFLLGVLFHYLWSRWEKSKIISRLQENKWGFLLQKDDKEQKAIKDLFDVAKIRGLYSGVDLQEEIKNYYALAKKVKIKVTRGYNIFVDDGSSSERDIFHTCINEIGKNTKRDIEILLHYPCLQNDHTKKRANANRITAEQYIESLFVVLSEVKSISSRTTNKNTITARFYDDYEIKWRYYLFETRANDKVLFLNYYDNKKSGADSAMLKVEFGSGTLCQDFDRKFDKIFSDEAFSKEIVSNLIDSSELVSKGLCRHKACKEKIEQLYSSTFK